MANALAESVIKKYKSTSGASSEQTNSLANDIIRKYKSSGAKETDTLRTGGTIPREFRVADVEQAIATRPDYLSEGLSSLWQVPGNITKQPVAESLRDVGYGALQTGLGIGQRAQAMVSNPLIELQKGQLQRNVATDPRQIYESLQQGTITPEQAMEQASGGLGQMAQSVSQGLTGERLGSLGDVARLAGSSAGMASGAENLGYALAPGVGEAAGAARIAILRPMSQAAKFVKQKAGKAAANRIFGLPQSEIKFIIESKGHGLEKGGKLSEPGAIGRVSDELLDEFTKKIRVPAKQLNDEVFPRASKTVLSGDEAASLGNALDEWAKTQKYDASTQTAVAELKKLGESREITLKDILDIQARLGDSATTGAGYGAQKLRDMLGSKFTWYGDAVKRWALFKEAEDVLAKIQEKAIYEGEEGFSKSGRSGLLGSYFSDTKDELVKNALEGEGVGRSRSLMQIYKDAGIPTTDLERIIKDAKGAISAESFRKTTPVNSAAAGRLLALPIGLGLLGGTAGYATGGPEGAFRGGAPAALLGGTVGLLAATPSTMGRMWGKALKPNPRGTFMQELMKRNMGEQAMDVGLGAAGIGALRGQIANQE